jgi:hypothetical protein
MEHRLDTYLNNLDRDTETQCACLEYISDNPQCPLHGENSCYEERKKQETSRE